MTIKNIVLYLLFGVLAACSRTKFSGEQETREVREISSDVVEDPESEGPDQETSVGEETEEKPATKPQKTKITIKDVSDVIQTCSSENKVLNQRIHFPATRKGCQYGKNGNFDAKKEINTAIGVQSQFITIPEQAVICGLNIQSRTSELRYDDFMIFTLNDQVLVNSNKSMICKKYPSSGCLAKDDYNIYKWDFSKVIGGRHVHDGSDKKKPYYCYGRGTEGNKCELPGHDKKGPVDFKLSLNSFAPLSLIIKDSKQLKFDLIITGDDNLDCEHTDLVLDVSINYVD